MNVIHVVAHDLGRDLGCYGRPIHSPHLDRFAQRAFRLTHAHATSVCCSPSRACAMTGLYPHHSGVMGLAHRQWAMPSSTRTIVDWLNDAGVETVHSGFQHERMAYRENRYAIELAKAPKDHFSQNAVDHAIGYLEGLAEQDKPFYLNIGTLESHPSVWQGARPGHGFEQDRAEQLARYDTYDDGLEPISVAGDRYPQNYRAAVTFFDREMGRLIDAIDRLGVGQNTWVIITVDHGAAFGQRRKDTLYELGTEIATLIRPPRGLEKEQPIENPIPNVDFAPTMAEMLGVQPPDYLDGQSFLSLLTDGTPESDRPILGFRNFHGLPPHDPALDFARSLRQRQMLLIWRPAVADRGHEIIELFDTASDPACACDLADSSQHREQAQAMHHRLLEMLETCGDPLVTGSMPTTVNDWIAEREFAASSLN